MVLERFELILMLLELFRAIFRTEREWYFDLWYCETSVLFVVQLLWFQSSARKTKCSPNESGESVRGSKADVSKIANVRK